MESITVSSPSHFAHKLHFTALDLTFHFHPPFSPFFALDATVSEDEVVDRLEFAQEDGYDDYSDTEVADSSSTDRDKENHHPRPFTRHSGVLTAQASKHRRDNRSESHRYHSSNMANTRSNGKTTKKGSKKQQQAAKQSRHAAKAAAKRAAESSDSEDDTTELTTNNQTKKQTDDPELLRLKKELEEAMAENQTLASELQSVKKRKGRSGSRVAVTTEMTKKFTEVTKHVVWKVCKFLVNDDQVFRATKIAMENIPQLQKKMVVAEKEQVEKWVEAYSEAYGSVITAALNGHRSERQGGLRTAYLERAKDGKKLPNPSELLQIVKRKDIDPKEHPENWELFLWYWEVLLTKVVGSKRWGYSQKYYGRISDHAPPDKPNDPYISASDEAMVVLLWENCGQRFPYAAKCAAKGEKENKKDKLYQSKYTDASCGQDKWGGWNAEGRKRFRELCRGITKSKNKRADAIKELETAALQHFQEKYKLNTDKKKGRKGRTPKDFEEDEEAEVEFGDYNGGEGSDDDDTDVEEFDAKYPDPKPKKAKI